MGARPKAAGSVGQGKLRIAVKIAYENGNLRETPKGQGRDCREVPDANFISRGYPARTKLIADRRVYLAGYRMAELMEQVSGR
jgi:hypothetical protein